jgi:bifunctional non-homologous end joining protein LigD
VFDVLAFDGEPTLRESYRARRELLDALPFDGIHAQVVPTFPEGDALFAAVCESGLEGVVAKRLRDRYLPGQRRWIKVKNRATPRFREELRSVTRQ